MNVHKIWEEDLSRTILMVMVFTHVPMNFETSNLYHQIQENVKQISITFLHQRTTSIYTML